MESKDKFDLIVIGSGPGGYVAAVRAAQLGLKTAVVEKEQRLGGVCLNVGCIPSKALLDSSEYYHLAQEKFIEHGIKIKSLELDLATMMARKNKVVAELTDNVQALLERNKVTILSGQGRLVDANRISVSQHIKGKEAVEVYEGKFILLATGSEPLQIPGFAFDGNTIVTSSQALSFDSVPKHLGVVGGGYIGLELGSVWARLGSEVTVIEMTPTIAGLLDGQVQRTLSRLLVRQGINIKTHTRVVSANVMKTRTKTGKVKLELEAKDSPETLECDRLLVAVGRRPLTRGLDIEKLNIDIDAKTGHIMVNENYQTNIPNVFAIGDLIAGPALAHKASAEGKAAVEFMAGLPGEVNYDTIPSVIYTWPEVASVGLTEEQVKTRNIPYCVGSYPFSGAGRARCMGETDGFVKLIKHAKTDRILGVHIIGPRASDMVAESVLAMEFGASAEDIAKTVHGHPTFSEAFMEAALSSAKCSIYSS